MPSLHHQGFTLMEMLLVMAIIALVLAVAPPLLSAAMPGLQLKSTARELTAALRQARSRAVTLGSDAALDLDLQGHRAQVSGSARTVTLPESLDISLVTADRELDDDQHGRIRFYPDGTSTGGRITLRHGTSGYAVDVDWLTGRVQLTAATSP